MRQPLQPIIFEQPEQVSSHCPRQDNELWRWWMLTLVITVLTLLLVTGMAFLLLTHTLPLFFMLFGALVLAMTGALSLPAAESILKRQPIPQAVTVSYIVDENGEWIPQIEAESPRR